MTKRVLIAEDDPAVAILVERLLGMHHHVTVVNDGLEALKLMRRDPSDLLVLDVGLPGIDGFSVARAVRESDGGREIPIIFLTARDAADDRLRAVKIGAKHYITKPFTIDDLVAKVHASLRSQPVGRPSAATPAPPASSLPGDAVTPTTPPGTPRRRL